MGEKSAYILVLVVVSLMGLGIVMLLSTSVFIADRADIYHDVHRQLVWLVLGVIACAFFAVVDYRFWNRSRWVWFVVACILLVLCFLPPFSQPANGAYRWIGGGEFGFDFARLQPSEMAKLAVIFMIAGWCSDSGEGIREVRAGFIYPLGIALIPVMLIACETDMGTAALLTCVVLTMLFVAGSRIWLFAGSAVLSVCVLALAVVQNPNRWQRLIAFMDLEAHKTGLGLQQWRAKLALGEGGISGLGLGEGREKLMYLPFAHTDFIFPMIGEELGVRATLLVVFAFVTVLILGVLIANSAPDPFGKLLGFGIVTLISIQAALNIGVTTAVLPNKGLPLPFVSYGGSNLLFSLAGIGILLNIYRQGSSIKSDDTGKLFDRCRAVPRI
ncbi:MAG: cell division protein FtsW [Verrucomicrobiaceae bacterium]|nr:cell division protein FtsW [Verrucomicrobiaceae bacterium]